MNLETDYRFFDISHPVFRMQSNFSKQLLRQARDDSFLAIYGLKTAICTFFLKKSRKMVDFTITPVILVCITDVIFRRRRYD